MIDENWDPTGTGIEAKERAQGYLWDKDQKKWVWQPGLENAKKGILITMRNGVPYDNEGNPISLMSGVALPSSIIAGNRATNIPDVELPMGREESKGTQTTGQVSQKWIDCTPETGKPIVVDWERGNRQFALLTQDKNVIMRNPKDQTCCLLLRQDATGGFEVGWGFNDLGDPPLLPACYWANGETPTMTVTPDAFDMFSFVWVVPWKLYVGMYTQNCMVPIP